MTMLEAITAQPKKKANTVVGRDTPFSRKAAGSNSATQTYAIMPESIEGMWVT
jgi:hypothetical protein